MKKDKTGVLSAVAGVVCLLLTLSAPQAGERYINNNNGTITDQKAKLIGLVEGNCLQSKNWEEAQAEVARIASGICALSDGSPPGSWRLPSKKELPILMDWKKSGMFPGPRTGFYWSSTTNEEDASLAWLIFLTTGYVGNDLKTSKNGLWPVR
ncbi:MAG: DUF1566 domain-containing protein, partial [Magnetococcales bacterium]|nr:DUF1566 domain-containing protein [Magnetococcales bacterium]